jgi:hypothetical protein
LEKTFSVFFQLFGRMRSLFTVFDSFFFPAGVALSPFSTENILLEDGR